ncbi:MAG: hypothetical protein PWQ65_493 [Bacteroidota bacterium]|jgi:hypothetical protein|nr:hypothetical protein [Bacteroidota bacterium]
MLQLVYFLQSEIKKIKFMLHKYAEMKQFNS